MIEENKHNQSSLAGVEINEEEKLRQANKAELQQKYRMITVALIAVIIVAGVIFVKSIWTGWGSSNGNRCYYIKGERVIGFANIDNNAYFFDDSGAMQTGWQDIQGSTYYFGADGVMQTSWIELDGNKYYLTAEGKLQTGWQTIGDSRYYFDPVYGVMQTGWQTVNGNTYYLNSNGIMQTGFQTINGDKYYLGDDGVRHSGWLELNNHKYYCSVSNNGKLAIGKWTIDGKNYYFDQTGIMTTGAVEISTNHVYYFDDNGHFQYCEITQNNIGSSWVDERVTFTSRGGGQTWSDYRKLDTPIEGVLSLSGEFSITEMEYGNCDGQWQLHVRTSNGKWKRIGFFEVKDGKGQFEFVLDDPASFDAYVCTCYESKKWAGSFRQDLNTVTYRTYDFGSNIKSE